MILSNDRLGDARGGYGGDRITIPSRMNSTRRFCQGEHVCSVYSAADERDALVTAYVLEGLEHNEQCLYGALSEHAIESVDNRLNHAGVDVAGAITRAQWIRLTPHQTHLVGGRFDAERMLRTLNDAIEAALTAGFTGFRACGDMSWLADEPPGCEQLVAYEAFLNNMFERQRALGLCLYDRQVLPSAVIDHALATHPSVALATSNVGNPYYRPEVASGSPTAHPHHVDSKLRELQQRQPSS